MLASNNLRRQYSRNLNMSTQSYLPRLTHHYIFRSGPQSSITAVVSRHRHLSLQRHHSFLQLALLPRELSQWIQDDHIDLEQRGCLLKLRHISHVTEHVHLLFQRHRGTSMCCFVASQRGAVTRTTRATLKREKERNTYTRDHDSAVAQSSSESIALIL